MSQERLLSGVAQPPMSNGELVFEAPWQGRVFAMANALCDAHAFAWAEFQQALIEVIGSNDATGGALSYYECFQQALEQVLAGKGVVDPAALSAQTQSILSRPHGHDH